MVRDLLNLLLYTYYYTDRTFKRAFILYTYRISELSRGVVKPRITKMNRKLFGIAQAVSLLLAATGLSCAGAQHTGTGLSPVRRPAHVKKKPIRGIHAHKLPGADS